MSRILMLLENNPYPNDGRVRRESLSLTHAGHTVTVIAPRGAQQAWHEVIDGVAVYRFPAPPEVSGFMGYLFEYGYAMVAMFCLSWVAFIRRGFDVIHAHNPPDTLVLIAMVYKLLGKRFVFDHHDLSPEMYQALFAERGKPTVHRLLIFFEKLSCRQADHIISTNHSYKTMVMQRANIPDERITIVRNGPDLSRLYAVPVDAALKQANQTTLCYVGEMGRHDGLDYLLRAIQHLLYSLNRTDFTCILVGDGDAWPELISQAERLQLTDYVQFMGRVPHSDVAKYLSAADICLAPEPSNSYNDRCTVIKLTEYLALGKPTVAFDLPEHRVTAGDAALYAQPNDELAFAHHIVTLMDDPARRQCMGEIGKQRTETQLAWAHQEKYLLTVYERMTRNGRTVQK